MKLTNTIRDAFMRAAMNDVPEVDYKEQYRSLMIDDAVSVLPPVVRKLWDNKTTRDYVHLAQVAGTTVYRNGFQAYVPGVAGHKPSASAVSLADELVRKSTEQDATRKALQEKLKQAAYGVGTRKALVDMLPEFEKYLPADEAAANRSVPVIANLVADFTKAGWPKGVSKK